MPETTLSLITKTTDLEVGYVDFVLVSGILEFIDSA